MATPTVQYFASMGIRVDKDSLRQVDAFLKKIETKLKSATKGSSLLVNLRIDESKFHKHLQGVLGRTSKAQGLSLKLTVDRAHLRQSIVSAIGNTAYQVRVTPTLSRISAAALSRAVGGSVPVSTRTRAGSTGGTGYGQYRPYGAEAASRRQSLTGRGDPTAMEYLSKGMTTAGNRRYSDAMASHALGGFGGSGQLGGLIRTAGQGVARLAGSTGLGRFGQLGGMALGGTRMGLVGGAAGLGISFIGSAVAGTWSAIGSMLLAPFRLLGSVVSGLTSSFYGLAQSLLPLAAIGYVIDQKVTESVSRGIALNTISKANGSSGAIEGAWLRNVADRDGMQYNALIDPFTSFIASASPSLGLAQAKGIFEAFTQFGVTRGSDNESMKRAMVAVSQMAGKGKIGAEELRQQLGDARGFGEMQSIFAEAYQMSMGRDPATMKKGQQALEELYKAMEDGKVYAAKVLPHVETIAKRLAEPGLTEARQSSIAERSRFMNQIGGFWRNFTQGGGDAGMGNFWRSMQRIGEWFETKGALVGWYFEYFTLMFDEMLLGLKELYQFATTGEATSITDAMKENGWDVDGIRTAVLGFFSAIGDVFTSVRNLLGFEDGKGAQELSGRIIRFSNQMTKVIQSLTNMLMSISQALQGWAAYNSMSSKDKIVALTVPGSEQNKQLLAITKGVTGAISGGISATADAANAVSSVLAPAPSTTTPTNNTLASARAGVLQNHSAMFGGDIPMYTPAMQKEFTSNRNVNIRIEADADVLRVLDGDALQRAVESASVDAANN